MLRELRGTSPHLRRGLNRRICGPAVVLEVVEFSEQLAFVEGEVLLWVDLLH